jgi:hypothetical protein
MRRTVTIKAPAEGAKKDVRRESSYNMGDDFVWNVGSASGGEL